jgi:hypothetical protein
METEGELDVFAQRIPLHGAVEPATIKSLPPVAHRAPAEPLNVRQNLGAVEEDVDPRLENEAPGRVVETERELESAPAAARHVLYSSADAADRSLVIVLEHSADFRKVLIIEDGVVIDEVHESNCWLQP